MPKYINNTDKDVFYRQYIFPVGEEIEIEAYIPERVGLTLTDDDPKLSYYLMSREVADETVWLPGGGRITVSILSETGATVYFADDTAGVPIPAGGGWEETDDWNRIGKIRIDGSGHVVVKAVR
jgi:hypothetical protein